MMMHETAPQSGDHLRRWVFVYGTLRRGEINDINRLRPTPRCVGRAALRGLLYDLGDYPGLLLERSLGHDDPLRVECADVTGEVYAIEASLETVLDEIEEVFPQQSGEYEKRCCTISVDGQTRQVLLYEIARDRLRGKSRIHGGDWVAYRRARDA